MYDDKIDSNLLIMISEFPFTLLEVVLKLEWLASCTPWVSSWDFPSTGSLDVL